MKLVSRINASFKKIDYGSIFFLVKKLKQRWGGPRGVCQKTRLFTGFFPDPFPIVSYEIRKCSFGSSQILFFFTFFGIFVGDDANDDDDGDDGEFICPR